jgi:hypothetical protein
VLKQISHPDRVVFLMTDMPTIRQDFLPAKTSTICWLVLIAFATLSRPQKYVSFDRIFLDK